MDKYLMSSPTMLSQSFEVGSENHIMHNMDLYDSHVEVGNERESQAGLSAIRERNSDPLDLEDGAEEMVPVSNNDKRNGLVQYPNDNMHMVDLQDINLNNFSALSHKFQNSVNVSLDDGLYNPQFMSNPRKNPPSFSHKSSLSTSSMVSINQDPPFASLNHNRIHSSYSNNTIYSIDSILPLSSSVSNQSLSDSPSSTQQSQPPTATPRGFNRKKSLSVSSNNLTTPLRGGNSITLSPVNLMTNKVSKTLYYGKTKGHTRSRSRLSSDFSNTHSLLNSVTKSASSQNIVTNNLNPFYTTAGNISPNLGKASAEVEGVYASLSTPTMSRSANLSNLQPLSTQFSSENAWSKSTSAELSKGLNSIEVQDDDAFKQLRKAKSYSCFNLAHNKSNGNFHNLEGQGLEMRNHNNSQSITNMTAQSAPGLLASPRLVYATNNVNQVSYFAPPLSTTSEHSKNNYFNNEQHINMVQSQLVSGSIKNSISSNNISLSSSQAGVKFTKSYPASTDLAAMTISPGDQKISGEDSQFQNTSQMDIRSLLPPMASFPTFGNDAIQQNILQKNHLSQDLNIPIKVSDKTETIDPKKKHQCPLCHARFQRPEHVKRHMKSHSSEKPFECDEPNCGKRFNRKDNLKAHLKKIHGRKV